MSLKYLWALFSQNLVWNVHWHPGERLTPIRIIAAPDAQSTSDRREFTLAVISLRQVLTISVFLSWALGSVWDQRVYCSPWLCYVIRGRWLSYIRCVLHIANPRRHHRASPQKNSRLCRLTLPRTPHLFLSGPSPARQIFVGLAMLVIVYWRISARLIAFSEGLAKFSSSV